MQHDANYYKILPIFQSVKLNFIDLIDDKHRVGHLRPDINSLISFELTAFGRNTRTSLTRSQLS